MQDTWVQSLGWEDPLEKEMATHSSILAWGNPMDRGAWQTIKSDLHSTTVLCAVECVQSSSTLRSPKS